MTTPKERMSDERLAQLREMYFNNQGVKNLFAECISEIDALRTELTATRERENETAGRVEAAILSLSAAKAEAERNWAEQEERGTIAQTDLNIALNKLATAERERDEFKSAYRQAADEVIEQSKRADRCYEAGIETGVAIGEQNKRDGLAEDRGGSLKEVFDTLKARASAAERERDEARAALAAIARNADDATDLSLFRVQCRDFAKSALKTTPTQESETP